MKLTNAEVFNTKEPFTELIKTKLPVLIGYQLAQMAGKVESQLRIIEQMKNKLIETYGEIKEDNPQVKTVTPDMASFPKFMEEYGQLMGAEIDIDIDKVELPLKVASACSNCHQITQSADLEIEPYILLALDKFISVQQPELVRR